MTNYNALAGLLDCEKLGRKVFLFPAGTNLLRHKWIRSTFDYLPNIGPDGVITRDWILEGRLETQFLQDLFGSHPLTLDQIEKRWFTCVRTGKPLLMEINKVIQERASKEILGR